MANLDSDRLLEDHRLYDQYVDVVSAFEWMFTDSRDMPDTVSHFERFPHVNGSDGEPATPDFSVLFHDGTGLVGEISRIALHEKSVDGLCRQIARYDKLRHLPGSNGSLAEVRQTDVLLLVPLDIGTDTVRRIIHERLDVESHEYKPQHAPCVVQFVALRDKYVFQRRSEAGNGRLRDEKRDPGLGRWFEAGDFKPPAQGFARVKAERPFMNDPVAPLYLACQLWTKLFPTLTADVPLVGDYKPLICTVGELAEDIRARYGHVGSTSLRHAMKILVESRCAEVLSVDRWRVAWGDLAHRWGEEIGEVLARRTQRPPAKGPIGRLAQAYEDRGTPDPERQPAPDPGRLF